MPRGKAPIHGAIGWHPRKLHAGINARSLEEYIKPKKLDKLHNSKHCHRMVRIIRARIRCAIGTYKGQHKKTPILTATERKARVEKIRNCSRRLLDFIKKNKDDSMELWAANLYEALLKTDVNTKSILHRALRRNGIHKGHQVTICICSFLFVFGFVFNDLITSLFHHYSCPFTYNHSL